MNRFRHVPEATRQNRSSSRLVMSEPITLLRVRASDLSQEPAQNRDIMQHKYSITLSRDEWDTMEVRTAWSRMIAGSSKAELMGQCPEFIDHLRSIHVPSRFCLALIRDSGGSIRSVVPLVTVRWG